MQSDHAKLRQTVVLRRFSTVAKRAGRSPPATTLTRPSGVADADVGLY
jgi:hypothetical protein